MTINLTAGLVGHWKLDQASYVGGKFQDISGYGNHGTGHGAQLGRTPTFVAGHSGIANSAVMFNGLDDYINCGNDASLNITDAITINAWVKPNNMIGGHHDGVIQHMDGCITNGYFLCFQGNNLTLVSGNNRVNAGDYNVPGFSAGKWYHVVFIWESTGSASSYQKFIINGGEKEQQRTISMSVSNPVESNLVIGRTVDCWRPQYLNGQMADVRIYNRVVNLNEALALAGIHKVNFVTIPANQTITINGEI